MIKVLVVEDEQVAGEAIRAYVLRVPGFEVAGLARSGLEALRFCDRDAVDLILLDFGLPDTDGLELCRRLRARGSTVHVIAVTARKDLGSVLAAHSLGVLHYILKPFAAAGLCDTLRSYAQFIHLLTKLGPLVCQADVAEIWRVLSGISRLVLPKGIDRVTLRRFIDALIEAPGGLTATMAAEATGACRVTARNYLTYLETNGVAQRTHRFGRGRPEGWFSLVPQLKDSPDDRSAGSGV